MISKWGTLKLEQEIIDASKEIKETKECMAKVETAKNQYSKSKEEFVVESAQITGFVILYLMV